MNSHYPLRVGLFGIGLEAYWPQFAGLKERLESHVAQVAAQLQRPGVEVVNLGLIDSPTKAMAAGHDFRRADVDVIFLHVTTYALSSTVLPVVQRAKVPVIILNLQPTGAIDYATFNKLGNRTQMTWQWLAHCGACPVPEIANAFNRARIDFHQVTGVLEGEHVVWDEIGEWIDAARVAHLMAHNRLGLMGHYYNGIVLDRSAVKVDAFAKSATSFSVTLKAYSSHTYQLQRSETLSGTWENIGAPRDGNDSIITFTDPDFAARPRVFYRVSVHP